MAVDTPEELTACTVAVKSVLVLPSSGIMQLNVAELLEHVNGLIGAGAEKEVALLEGT